MHNELFSIGPFTVYGYGLMIAIGIFSAYCLAEYRARRLGLDDERVFGLTIWAVVGGILGGKILFYLTILPQIAADPSLLYRDLMEGFVIYGALIGGFLGIVLYCRRWRIRVLSYLDLALPSVALAQGFGRIGCLLAGCCYGQETDSAFCIVFQNSAYAPNGVPLVPTQIISSVLNFLHFGLLILFAKKWKKGEGQVTGLYFALYSAGRFVLEFFRGDLERGSVGALSTSQFIAIFAFLFGAALFVWAGIRHGGRKCRDCIGRRWEWTQAEAATQTGSRREQRTGRMKRHGIENRKYRASGFCDTGAYGRGKRPAISFALP